MNKKADKKIIEDIKKLKKENKYAEIFDKYGKEKFNKYVSYKYKKEDLKKLRQEGRYEDIFRKYGKATYNQVLSEIKYKEIKEAKGQFKANLWKTSNIIKKIGGILLIGTSSAVVAGNLGAITGLQEYQEENAIKYEKEIDEYNEKISKYAANVQKMDLNDIQILMKVTDDMWKHIKGYGTPNKNIIGFLELDLATEEGQGVCRNMASDVAKKLNKINPKYNARTMPVYMDEDGYLIMADIEQKILEEDQDIITEDKENEENKENKENEENEEDSKNDENKENKEDNKNNENKTEETNKTELDITKFTGNHMVTFVDIPEDKLILVLDPTNPSIGIYKNGKITILNGDKKMYPKEYVNAIWFKGYPKDILNTAEDYIRSFKDSNLSYEEIQNKYGLVAQNKALEEVRKLENIDNKKEFKKSIKKEANKNNTDNKNIENYSNIEIEQEKDDMER